MGDTPAARVVRSETAPAKPAPVAAAKPSVAPPGAKPPPPPTPVARVAPAVKKKWRDEEPEPRRCPGCGTKTHAARCPGCGTKLIHDEE